MPLLRAERRPVHEVRHGVSFVPAMTSLPRNAGVTEWGSLLDEELERRVTERTKKLMAIIEAQRQQISQLRNTEVALRSQESRWYSFFSRAAVGLAELSLGGKYERVNDALCTVVGRSRGDLIASNLASGVHLEDRHVVMAAFRETIELGTPRSIESRFLRNDSTIAWVSARFTRLEDEEGRPTGVLAAAVEVTEQKRAQLALYKSEAELRALFQSAALGIVHVDTPHQRLIRVNDRFSAMLGYSPRELRQLTFPDVTHPEDLAGDQELYEQAASGEIDEYSVRKRLHRVDGTYFWSMVSISLIRDENGEPTGAVAVVQDISQRVATEAELQRIQDELETRVQQRTAQLDEANRALKQEIGEREHAEKVRDDVLRQLASAQEDERRRISRELHDEIGQHLTALMLGLRSLRSGIRQPGGFETLCRLESIAETVGKGVHDLARELRPTALDDLGLLRTLANYIDDWSQRTCVGVDFHSSGFTDTRLPPAIENTLYRIVQEALNNVIKHAAAKRASVILERAASHVTAIVEDDGAGFDADKMQDPSSGKRLGILGMQERVRLVNGEVRIESTAGQGTSVFVRIPLASEETPKIL